MFNISFYEILNISIILYKSKGDQQIYEKNYGDF